MGYNVRDQFKKKIKWNKNIGIMFEDNIELIFSVIKKKH
jgi:hypothetical protein